jgi:hypothetical protein
MRLPQRVFGVLGVLALAWGAWGATLTPRALPPSESLREWALQTNNVGDDSLNQEWKKTLTKLKVNEDGYLLLTYQVVKGETKEKAASVAAYMLSKSRFAGEVAKGYAVDATPWAAQPGKGVVFTVSGTDHTLEGDRAHFANLYTFAFTQDGYAIFLEARESVNAPDLIAAQRALRDTGLSTLAEDFSRLVVTLWTAPGGPTPPPTTTPPITTPPETTTPPTTTPPETTTPPTTTPTPPVDGTRWSTIDGHLSLVLPTGAAVLGETVCVFTGVGDAVISLYGPDGYKDEKDLSKWLEDFATTQQAIATGNYTRVTADLGGARGLRVAYLTVDFATRRSFERIVYCFGKDGRLWQLQIDLTGNKDVVPPEVTKLLASLTLQ